MTVSVVSAIMSGGDRETDRQEIVILLTASLLCKCRNGRAPVLSYRRAVLTSVADSRVKPARVRVVTLRKVEWVKRGKLNATS